jgi:hypothetical protein
LGIGERVECVFALYLALERRCRVVTLRDSMRFYMERKKSKEVPEVEDIFGGKMMGNLGMMNKTVYWILEF